MMNDRFLSQEEINSLIQKNNEINNDQGIRDKIKDYLIDLGYKSMNAATKRLSNVIKKNISLTKPHSDIIVLYDFFKNLNDSYILAEIENSGSIKGTYLLLIKANDAAVIGGLISGNNDVVENGEITERQLLTIRQAINLIVGSLSTEISKNTNVNIRGKVTNFSLVDNSDVTMNNIYMDDTVIMQNYSVDIEGILKTEIIQILSIDFAEEIATQSSSEGNTSSSKQTPRKEETMSKEDISVKTPKFSNLTEANNKKMNNIDLILDVPLEFSVVLGNTKKSIREVLSLNPGSIIELNKYTEEPLEVYVNGKLIAQGEVVVVDENFGVRITNIISTEDRIKGLK